jgi:hypothetical protein
MSDSAPERDPDLGPDEAASHVGPTRRRMAISFRSREHWPALAPFALLALLAVAVVLPNLAPPLSLANPDRGAVSGFRAAIGNLPADPLVLVAFDADFGTYPEISYATRAALAELSGSGASLAFVSYSPEGRALAAAEVDRLQRDGVPADRLLDLGYRSGVEAGLVQSVTSIVPEDVSGPLAGRVRAEGGGIDAFDLALIVGGSDLGPRIWVEQVATRIPKLPLVAIAPTVLRPELEPYLASGQLEGLLGTLRDGVAYGRDSGTAPDRPPSALAMLLGMLIGIGVLVEAAGGRLAATLSSLPGRRRR